MSNIDLWDDLCSPDGNYVKKVPGGSKLSSIDAMWRVKRLTEMFGPCGRGWGFDTEPYTLVQLDVPFSAKKGEQPQRKTAVYVRGRVWYRQDDSGDRFYTPYVSGGTEVLGMNIDDAVKMAETDAFGKAASYLGLAADVYMGEFSNDKYLAKAKARESGQSSGNAPDTGSGQTGGKHDLQTRPHSDDNPSPAEVVAANDPGGFVLQFGKHKGKTLAEVDAGWIEWFVKNYDPNKNNSEDRQVLYACCLQIQGGETTASKTDRAQGRAKQEAAAAKTEGEAPWV